MYRRRKHFSHERLTRQEKATSKIICLSLNLRNIIDSYFYSIMEYYMSYFMRYIKVKPR